MSRRLRVLLLIHDLDVGGAQVMVLNLAVALARLQCDPIVCPWRRSGPLEARFLEAGIRIERLDGDLSGWRRTRVPGALAKIIREQAIDLVHAHLSDSAVWAALAQRMTGVPSVVTHHTNQLIDLSGEGRPIYGWVRRRLLTLSARGVALNIGVSDAVRERLIQATGLADAGAITIMNGIPVPKAAIVEADRAGRAIRNGANPDPAGPRLVFVGRLHESKDVGTLITVLANLRKSRPGATLEIVGDGATMSDLRAQAAAARLDQAIHFAGFQTEVGSYLASADLFVSASLVEGLPIAVLEAMARGLPVIVTDIPGHREIVRPGETGRLVRVSDPESLHAAIEVTLGAWDETERLADAGVALVGGTYSADRMAKRHLEVYRSLANDRVAKQP